MTSFAMAESNNERGTTDRALRWIGDLDHPFYSDERNRYVWYEASAIGFQLLFLGSYFVAAFLLLVFGGPAMPWVLAMFVPTMLTAIVFQSYLKRHSAEYWPGKNDLVRRRGQVAVLAGLLVVLGLVRASLDLSTGGGGPSDSFFSGAASGAVAGIVVGPLIAVAVLAYKRRQSENALESDDDI